ncbi:MAG: DUF1648 domain-containing protein [Armatimonadota bacterium]
MQFSQQDLLLSKLKIEETVGYRDRRPIIIITPTPTDQIAEVVTVLGVGLGIITLLLHWHELPERIPTHFNCWGKPDSWEQKCDLFILEGLAVFLYLLLSMLNRFPHIQLSSSYYQG